MYVYVCMSRRIKEVLYRRPSAPEPSKLFRVSEDRLPARGCPGERQEPGRREEPGTQRRKKDPSGYSG
jgi:hypothetical protein